jgi:hypothetical protein
MRVAPAFSKRFGDFQPDHGTAVSLLFQWRNIIAEKDKHYWGTLSPPGEGTNIKNGNRGCRFAFT